MEIKLVIKQEDEDELKGIVRESKLAVKMLFCDYVNEPIFLDTVGTYEIPYTSEYVADAFAECNKHLDGYLRSKKIMHFIPRQKPTFEIKNEFEICYYFARTMYEYVYNSTPGIVMMPNGDLLRRIEQFYEMYHLNGWEDERAYS